MLGRLGEDRWSPLVGEVEDRRGAVVAVRAYLTDHPPLLVNRDEIAICSAGRHRGGDEEKDKGGFHDGYEESNRDAGRPPSRTADFRWMRQAGRGTRDTSCSSFCVSRPVPVHALRELPRLWNPRSLDVGTYVDAIANDHAANVQVLVPMQAEGLPIDRSADFVGCAGDVTVPTPRTHGHHELDGLNDPVQLERPSRDEMLIVDESDHLTGKSGDGEMPDIEKLRRPNLRVALGRSRIDAREIDPTRQA